MARVVATVIPEYADSIQWETVITKEIGGALRYTELSQKFGRPMPVPSIIINGDLAFESIPSIEELRECLDRLIEEIS